MKGSFFYLLTIYSFLFFSCTEKTNTISIIGEDSGTLNAISQLKAEYEEETGIKVNIEALPFAESMEKSDKDLSQKSGKYDIVMQYNFSLSPYVRNNYVYSLDELTPLVDPSKLDFEKDLFQADWEEVGYYYKDFKNSTLGSKKVGYPFASNTMLLVYNKKWFDDAQNKENFLKKYGKDLVVPSTWLEFKDIAAFFTDPSKNKYGICMEGADGGWLYYQWANMLFGMGGKVMDKKRGWEGDINTPVMLNSPEALATMEMLKNLKPYNKGDFFTVDAPSQRASMKEGNVALAIMWSDLLYDLINLDSLQNSNFGFAVVPGKVSMNAGGSFFINRNSKNAKEAMNFIAWLMKKENQVRMIKRGLCSPRMSAYDDPSVASIPYLQALKTSLHRGVYMAEAGPDADVINQNITKYAQKVWKGDLSPKDAVAQLQDEVLKERAKVFENIK
jgi:multiple sugar transport system substrate-binding protein